MRAPLIEANAQAPVEIRLNRLNADTAEQVTLTRLIGEGSSCLAYEGKWRIAEGDTPAAHDVIVKEFYPEGVELERVGPGLRCTGPDEEDYFQELKDVFKAGVIQAARYYECHDRKDIFVPCEANGTIYVMSLKGSGSTLAKLLEDKTVDLQECAEILISTCNFIGPLHEDGYLYLDLKPENISCEERDDRWFAELFDFDTVTRIKDIENGEAVYQTSSAGYSAPEQFYDFTKVSVKSDLFAVGSILYRAVLGSAITAVKRNKSKFDAIRDGQIDLSGAKLLARYPDYKELTEHLKKILAGTMAFDAAERTYETAGELKEDLERLKGFLVGESAVYDPIHKQLGDIKQQLSELTGKGQDINTGLEYSPEQNRFRYDSGSVAFFGRSKEMQYLEDFCLSDGKFAWTGLNGPAGSGKSRLAFELCRRMDALGWSVKRPYHIDGTYIGELLEAVLKRSRDMLVCIDYVKMELSNIVDNFLRPILRHLPEREPKIRVLLIERESNDLVIKEYNIDHYKFTSPEGQGFIDENGFVGLKSFAGTDINDVFRSYIEGTGRDVRVEPEDLQLMADTLKRVDPEEERPLFALFIADAWSRGESLVHWDRKAALDYILSREEERIRKIIAEEVSSGAEREQYYAAVKRLWTNVTYMEGVGTEELQEELIRGCGGGLKENVLKYILENAGILDRASGALRGLEPDLLGEYFCIRVFDGSGKQWASDTIDYIFKKDFRSAVSYSDKIYNDYYEFDAERRETSEWLPVIRDLYFPKHFTYIAKRSFQGCRFLRSVVLHDRITRIDQEAFRGCSELEEIDIPESVETLGSRCFAECRKLQKIRMMSGIRVLSSLREIGTAAFENCEALEIAFLPNTVEKIGSLAFRGCRSLRTIHIPGGVDQLKDSLLENCEQLEHVYLNEGRIQPHRISDRVFFGCSRLQEIDISNVSTIGDNAFTGCRSLKAVTNTPYLMKLERNAFIDCSSLEQVDLRKSRIRTIGSRTFMGCSNLSEVLLPEGLETVEKLAFAGCSALQEIRMPASVKKIANDAFYSLEEMEKDGTEAAAAEHIEASGTKAAPKQDEALNVEKIVVPASCRDLSEWEFRKYKSLREVILPAKLTTLPENLFADCKALERVVLPEKLRVIPEFCFKNCSSLVDVKMPRGLLSIRGSAFISCSSLERISLPPQINNISRCAFKGCKKLMRVDGVGSTQLRRISNGTFSFCGNLESIELPKTISSIGSGSFRGCSKLKGVKIPAGVKDIGSNAFYGCYKLEEIVIPRGMTRISEGSFYQCSSLTRVIMPENITAIEDSAFYGCSSLSAIHLPADLEKIGKFAFAKCHKLEKMELPSRIRTLMRGSFADCDHLLEITIPDSIREIPSECFKECKNLPHIVFPENLKKIGTDAFRGCMALSDITLPDSLTELGPACFKYCDSIKAATLPQGIDVIPAGAFCSCRSLESVSFDRVKAIEDTAFADCIQLRKFPFDKIEGTIGVSAFQGCTELEKAHFAGNIKSLGSSAFRGCTKLANVVFEGDGSLEIGEDVFRGCENLYYITLPENTSLHEYAFRECPAGEYI